MGPRFGQPRGICVALAVLAVLAASTPAAAEPRTVRVGIYENEPKIFTIAEENGRPAGIFVDLLEQIAAEEGWTLVWVPGTWDEGLRALEDGKIDLMPDVAYSAERDEVYDFHKTPVVEHWSCVYAAPSRHADSTLSDFDGKRVAVLGGSIQETVFSQMTSGLGYDVELIPAASLEEAFQLASGGKADAAIANNLFGDYFAHDYGLTKTSIVFGAVRMYYATAERQNTGLLDTIDRHLNAWVQEPGSTYYQTLIRYTAKEPAPELPAWAFWGMVVSIGLLFLAAIGIVLLRWQVRVKTRHLAVATEAATKAEETLHLALDAAEEGVFDWYPKTGEVIWSPRNFTMLGYEPDEFSMNVEKYLDLIHPDDRELVAERLRQFSADGRPFLHEFRLRRKSGDWQWTLGRGMAVAFDAQGGVERVMGTNTDVTERKKAEDELSEYREHLEELVESRTHELREVNAKLEEATAAKSRFLTTMSHELRTPLNSVIGFSGLLSSGMVGRLTKEQAFQTEMIHEAGQHLLELINGILDLSKVEAGAIDIHLGPVDAVELVTSVAETLRPLAVEKGLELRVETPDGEMPIETDRNRLRQILLNLVGNAVKFTAAGEVCVSVERDHDGGVAFIVSDTGPGIPAGEIDHVFDAFHQAEQVGAELPTGTGLGLTISKDFAHLLQGEITVTSVEGEGSVFTLWLPASCV